jgi:hypothetical protein
MKRSLIIVLLAAATVVLSGQKFFQRTTPGVHIMPVGDQDAIVFHQWIWPADGSAPQYLQVGISADDIIKLHRIVSDLDRGHEAE